MSATRNMDKEFFEYEKYDLERIDREFFCDLYVVVNWALLQGFGDIGSFKKYHSAKGKESPLSLA